jgi:hypothetical protein
MCLKMSIQSEHVTNNSGTHSDVSILLLLINEFINSLIKALWKQKASNPCYARYSTPFSKSKSRPKSDFGLGPNLILVWDQIWFWSGTKSNFGLGPNQILVLDQIRFGSGFGPRPKFDLVPDPNRIWSQTRIGFGLGPESDLVSDPNRIWSPT